jgi:hypothetical protein
MICLPTPSLRLGTLGFLELCNPLHLISGIVAKLVDTASAGLEGHDTDLVDISSRAAVINRVLHDLLDMVTLIDLSLAFIL